MPALSTSFQCRCCSIPTLVEALSPTRSRKQQLATTTHTSGCMALDPQFTSFWPARVGSCTLFQKAVERIEAQGDYLALRVAITQKEPILHCNLLHAILMLVFVFCSTFIALNLHVSLESTYKQKIHSAVYKSKRVLPGVTGLLLTPNCGSS